MDAIVQALSTHIKMGRAAAYSASLQTNSRRRRLKRTYIFAAIFMSDMLRRALRLRVEKSEVAPFKEKTLHRIRTAKDSLRFPVLDHCAAFRWILIGRNWRHRDQRNSVINHESARQRLNSKQQLTRHLGTRGNLCRSRDAYTDTWPMVFTEFSPISRYICWVDLKDGLVAGKRKATM